MPRDPDIAHVGDTTYEQAEYYIEWRRDKYQERNWHMPYRDDDSWWGEDHLALIDAMNRLALIYRDADFRLVRRTVTDTVVNAAVRVDEEDNA